MILSDPHIGAVIEPPKPELIETLHDYWSQINGSLKTSLNAQEFSFLQKKFPWVRRSELLIALAQLISGYAHPPQSEYPVGVVGITSLGDVVFGVNFEIGGQPLNSTLHGEQVLIRRMAANRGATTATLKEIALSAAPCGHCRQFINETADADQIRLHVPGLASNIPFPIFLPDDFGPKDLGIPTGALLDHQAFRIQPISDHFARLIARDSVIMAASESAMWSYSPYTRSPAGVAIETRDGSIHSGSYIENVAFNPSISPFSAALVSMLIDSSVWAENPSHKRGRFHEMYERIARVILVERPPNPHQDTSAPQHPSFEESIRSFIGQFAPEAALEVYNIDILQSNE